MWGQGVVKSLSRSRSRSRSRSLGLVGVAERVRHGWVGGTRRESVPGGSCRAIHGAHGPANPPVPHPGHWAGCQGKCGRCRKSDARLDAASGRDAGNECDAGNGRDAGNERDDRNAMGRSTPCVDGRAQRGDDRADQLLTACSVRLESADERRRFWMQNACVGHGRVVPAAGRLPADADQRRLKRCTASTKTCTCSGFMSGDMPWPRLKTWPSREPPLPWA